MWDTTVLTGLTVRYDIAIEGTGSILKKIEKVISHEGMPPK